MKAAREWDKAYILGLPAGEHDWVEFKGAKSIDFTLPGGDENKALDDLSKQLSAFSNSGGGTLIYGVADPRPGQPRVVDAGGVSLQLRGRGTKEWLEDVIPNLVEFPLKTFNVYVLVGADGESGITDGKCILVIDIPGSEYAPHQARDKKYYARVGGKSRPIGHRMVLDIIGRASHPKIELKLRFVEIAYYGGEYKKFYLEARCFNTGRLLANYVNGFIKVPTSMISPDEEFQDVVDKEHTNLIVQNLHRDVLSVELGFNSPAQIRSITRFNPILPGLGHTQRFELAISSDALSKYDGSIQWTIHADNMPASSGSVAVKTLKVKRIERGDF